MQVGIHVFSTRNQNKMHKVYIISTQAIAVYYESAFFQPSSVHFLVKRKVNCIIEQRKGHEKLIVQFRKWNLIIRFSSDVKILPIDELFSNLINFYQKKGQS